MAEPARHERRGPWRVRAHRARHAMRHSLRVRLVALFLLLALGVTATFLVGMQKALSVGWRDAARPLVADYVDRLVAELGSPPRIERAEALSRRLPVAVRISGPTVNWRSDADAAPSGWAAWRDRSDAEPRLLERRTADGHLVRFTLHVAAWQDPPRRIGWVTLTVLLVLTALAYAWVRHLLRPLDDIRAGAERYGAGDFSRPIPLRRRDELGDLAHRINTMARDLQGMLDAKRALLLAISHELRSPLTRARLQTELLPETGEHQAPREALLRDLALMRDLVTDLLESERLSARHSALNLEPVDLVALAREVLRGFGEEGGQAGSSPDGRIVLRAPDTLAPRPLDPARLRLLLRNLLDNALRHSPEDGPPVELSIEEAPDGGLAIQVRDHGPGVPESELERLAEPFYRPDSARTRASGGVGLGLYLCRLVAEAHGGRLRLGRAEPGLRVRVELPAA